MSHWPRRGSTKTQAGLRLGFRSGLEEKNAQHLEALGCPVLFETLKVKYAVPSTMHTYTPDFPLPNGIIVETKGRWLPVDRAKHLFVRAQYPDLDIRIVFSSSRARIAPGSSTTLGMWADKHGFKWADKLIPEAWVREQGPGWEAMQATLAKGPLGYDDIFKTPIPKRKTKT